MCNPRSPLQIDYLKFNDGGALKMSSTLFFSHFIGNEATPFTLGISWEKGQFWESLIKRKCFKDAV